MMPIILFVGHFIHTVHYKLALFISQPSVFDFLGSGTLQTNPLQDEADNITATSPGDDCGLCAKALYDYQAGE